MRRTTRLALAGAVSAVALALTPAAALAHGGDDNGTLIKAKLTASTSPKNGGLPILGVPPGGRDWIIAKGKVRVRADGRTDVRIDGLQIPAADSPTGVTTNPVASIAVSLYCGGTKAATSDPQPLSVPDGDARFRTTLVGVPSECDMATVLIGPAGANAYIASAVADDEDDD